MKHTLSITSLKTNNIAFFLTDKLPGNVLRHLTHLTTLSGYRHLAIMPDAHLAGPSCVGAVLATENTIYPTAVGKRAARNYAERPIIRLKTKRTTPTAKFHIFLDIPGLDAYFRHIASCRKPFPPRVCQAR